MIDQEHNIRKHLDGCRTVEEWIKYNGYELEDFDEEDMREIRKEFEERLNLDKETGYILDGFFANHRYISQYWRSSQKKTMTTQEYRELQKQFDDTEVFKEQAKRFYREHPDAPKANPIHKLSLVMKRVFAEQIIRGEKRVEIRAEGPKYYGMMMDKDTVAYMEEHIDDELMALQMFDFLWPVRPVKTIHFYTYNNSWSMDVECECNWKIAVTDENVQELHEMYDCHDFDELLSELNAHNVPIEDRPVFYCFAIGKVINRHNI